MRLCVKDYMSKDIKSVRPDMSAGEALKLMLKMHMSGFPVIDDNGDAVGVFTEKEILKAIVPAYVKDVGNFIYAKDPKSELKKIIGLEKFLVSDLMRKEVPMIDENASLAEAARIILTKSERRIIVSRGCKPVGVITRCDVVTALAQEAGAMG